MAIPSSGPVNEAIRLALHMQNALDYIRKVTELANMLVKHPDLSEVQAAFMTGMSGPTLRLGDVDRVVKVANMQMVDAMDLLQFTIKLRNLEAQRGEGDWRREDSHLPAVALIRGLREHHPELSMHEARVLVEAYKEQKIK